MSFLDALGEWTGVPRMANDISLAWANAFEPEDQNVLVSAYAGIMGAGNRAIQWTSPTDHGAVPAIGNLAYQGAGVVTRGIATTTAINNYDRWKLPGQTEQQYRDMVTKSITDQDWQTSLGQVVLSDAAYNMDADTPWFARNPAEHLAISAGLKPGQNLNPFDPAQRETQFTGDGAPGKYQSGFYDAFSSNLADPTNLAGPAFKGYKALALGEKALVGTKVSSVWRPTSIAKTDFLDQLTNTNKYAGFVDFAAAESSAAKIAEHEYVKRSMRDPQLASYLLAKAGDRESVIDTLNVLGKLGDDASVKAAADRLVAKAPNQGENAYLVDRIVNGEAERAYQAATGSDHVLDPGIRDMQAKMLASFLNDDSNALGRAYQASLNKAMDAPVGTLSVTPKTGVAAKWNVAAAEARGDRLYAKPNVTYHQPTKAHPLMVAFDFFTKGRPSGYANTHDLDSFKEFSALVQHIDKYTDGALRGTGEAESWMNSYMAAQSATDRMSLFQNLEQRGVDIMAGNKGLDSETARSIYEFTAQKRRTALSAYEKDGFFSYLNNGNPALAVGPLTLRQAANDIHIALDFRQLDKTLNRISPDGWKSILAGPKSDMLPQGAWAAGRDKVVHGLDILNDLFKMNVLLRLGYTVRNLTEAGLSMAASGYMTSVAMTARPGEAAKAWAANRKIGAAQMADRMGVRTGRRESVRALQDEVGDALATLRTEDANAELMTQYLAGFKMDAADVPDDLYPVLARLRGETDRDVTYHLTTNGLPSIDGDFLATVSKRNVAQRKLDDMYTYRSVEDFGHSPDGGAPVDRGQRLTSLIDDARARLRAGEALEYKTPQGWAPMTEKTIDSFMAARSHTGVFKPRAEDMRMVVRGRQRGAVPEVVAVPSYGRTLDARAGVAGVDVNDRTALAAYARENGYGRVVVDDPQWGETTLVLRDTADYAGGEGAAPVVRRHVQNIIREAEETGGVELMPPTAKQVRARNRAAATQAGANRNRNRARTNGRRSVIPGWSRSQVKAMVDSGLIDRLQEVGARRAQAKAALDFAEERYAARKAQASGVYRDKVQSNSGRGQAFDVTSPQAQVMRSRTSSESTQDKLIGAGDEQMMMPATTMVSTTLSPNDSRYFEGWANAINHHMRDPESMTPDPLVKMLMDGKSEDDLVDWLEGAGRDHADYLGWGENLEDRVAELSSAFDLYVPEGQIRQAFANGEDITEDMLRGIYGRRQDLPDLQARLVPGAAEQRASVLADSLVARSARRMFHFLGALPETTFARHPLFVAAYDTERARLVEQLKARGHQSVTMENLNKIEFQAREFARQEVNRTLYTINRRTDAARQLRLVSPFYGAWENAIKRWSGFVWHNPDKVMRMTSKAAMVWNNVVIVDENGDVIPAEKALSNYDTFRNAQIVWPGADMSKIESASRINLASLDVITGGQPGPGLGPYGLLPLYEIAKDRPDIAETMSWAFPVGMPKDELDLFMSAAQKRIRSAATEDKTFVNDMNKTYQDQYIKFMNGERSTKPTVEEVRDSAKKLYGLRLLTSLTLPVSVDFNNDVDFYVNQLRTLRDLYKDEEGGEQKADAEFIDKYPNAFIVLPSLSDNRAGALATVGTVNNMKRYGNLASEAEAIGDLKMFGWVANYGQGNYSKDNFSQAAYSWQSNTRLPGSDTTYRGRQNTADLEAQALQDAGWVEFGRVMDVTEARLKAKGIDPTSKIGTKLLSEVRQAFSNDMKTKNPTWYQDYADPDRGKWERRAQFFSTVLADKQFMQDHGNDPLVKQIGVYLSFRNEVARALQARDERGGSAMLSAKSNADIQAYWLGEVEKMKDANIEFAAWQTRYFTNDPVVF